MLPEEPNYAERSAISIMDTSLENPRHPLVNPEDAAILTYIVSIVTVLLGLFHVDMLTEGAQTYRRTVVSSWRLPGMWIGTPGDWYPGIASHLCSTAHNKNVISPIFCAI